MTIDVGRQLDRAGECYLVAAMNLETELDQAAATVSELVGADADLCSFMLLGFCEGSNEPGASWDTRRRIRDLEGFDDVLERLQGFLRIERERVEHVAQLLGRDIDDCGMMLAHYYGEEVGTGYAIAPLSEWHARQDRPA